jgi:hypothetical protein
VDLGAVRVRVSLARESTVAISPSASISLSPQLAKYILVSLEPVQVLHTTWDVGCYKVSHDEMHLLKPPKKNITAGELSRRRVLKRHSASANEASAAPPLVALENSCDFELDAATTGIMLP